MNSNEWTFQLGMLRSGRFSFTPFLKCDRTQVTSSDRSRSESRVPFSSAIHLGCSHFPGPRPPLRPTPVSLAYQGGSFLLRQRLRCQHPAVRWPWCIWLQARKGREWVPEAWPMVLAANPRVVVDLQRCPMNQVASSVIGRDECV